MSDLSIINCVKYNRTIFKIYNYVGSKLILLLKQFLRSDGHLIVFVSFGGRKFDDSPKAIYEAMITDRRFDSCKLVWAFIRPEDYKLSRGEKVKIDTFSYYKLLLRARVWVTNSSMTRGLSFTGIDTFELNTWHGSAIKHLGCDISQETKSFGLNNKAKTKGVMLAQGQYDVDVFSKAFNRPIDSFRITGLPRNDELANATHKMQSLCKKKLGIAVEKKVILYAPTFREYEKDSNSNCVMTPPMNLTKWESVLGNDYVLLIRAHYEVAQVMGVVDNDFVINVSNYPNLNELLIASDMLISDYSSIFFDYAILGKPMICFAYDYDRYERERGLYFDLRNYLPSASDEDQLLTTILGTDISSQNSSTVKFRSDYVTEYGSATLKCLDIVIQIINSTL